MGCLFGALAVGSGWGQTKPAMQWTTTIQSGMADTFQLTLGGTFGNGPAWQSRLTTGLSNAFRGGDSLFVYGWDTFDTRAEAHDFQAGFGYKAPVWKRRSQVLSLGSGLQYWRFPSVKTGANDWLIPGNLTYQAKVKKTGLLVTSDSWTLLNSPLPMGSLLHTQVWVEHDLLKTDSVRIALRHGPAHTYSWGFYGTNGNRVFRYQSMLAITTMGFTLEGGFRKQAGLQDGIHHNNYWQFALTRTFRRPLH
jgi:hypothetical protein